MSVKTLKWYENPAEYTAVEHDGREVRIYKGIKAHDALLANPAALANAVRAASRFPFAFTANQGLVMADRI